MTGPEECSILAWHMDRTARLERNPRLLFFARLFGNVKIMNAIVTLFYLHRGLPFDQVIYLSAIFGAMTLVVEVPTGYLADRFGRRRTLQLGFLCLIASQSLHWIAHDFLTFALAFIFMAFAFSCVSGTEEAALYDTLKELGREKEMTKHWGRLLSAQNLPKIFFPPLGALIAKDLLEWQFQILIAVDIVAALLGLLVLQWITEPAHARDVAKQEEGIFRESVRTIRERPLLLRVGLNKVIPFVVNILLWRVYQAHLYDHGASVLWLGAFYIFMHTVIFSTRWFSDRLENRFGDARMLNATLLGLFVSTLATVFTQNVWVLSFFFLAAFCLHSLREPMYSHWMNRHISSYSRATTLSNLNMFRSFFDIPLMLIGGFLAIIDVRWTLLLCAVVCLWVFVFLRVPKETEIRN